MNVVHRKALLQILLNGDLSFQDSAKLKQLTISISLSRQNQYMSLLEMFIKPFSFTLQQKIMKRHKQCINRYIQFQCQFMSLQWHKKWYVLQQRWLFDRDAIDAFYAKWSKTTVLNIRQKLFINLYEYVNINGIDLSKKYASYQFLQYIITAPASVFSNQIIMKNDQNITQLLKMLEQNNIDNINSFKHYLSLSHHIEISRFCIKFSDKFTPENVSNDILLDIFSNIENRIQYIDSTDNFVLAKKVDDEQTIKCKIDQYNIQTLENQFNMIGQGLVDVIIAVGKQQSLNTIGELHIRSLCYRRWFNSTNLFIHHQEDLVSLTLQYVKIMNLSQCINIQNLCSIQNSYTQDDILYFHNLKRICSYWDDYTSGYMISDLFMNNKLEYVVFINQNGQSQKKVIVFSKNIINLRFLHIEQYKAQYEIQLNVNDEYPSELKVYFVYSSGKQQNDLSDIKYGTIQGRNGLDNKLEKQLIHEVKRNLQQ